MKSPFVCEKRHGSKKSVVFLRQWWYNKQNYVVLSMTIDLGGITHGRE